MDHSDRGSKIKRRRNRKAASCEPCRSRKGRCDRGYPCASCERSGVTCVWDEESLPPLYNRGDKNEIEALSHEVSRLQKLVDLMMTNQLEPSNGSSSSQSGYHSSPETRRKPLGELAEEQHDVGREDIIQRLGQLALTHVWHEPLPGGTDESHDHLFKEVQLALESSTFSRPVPDFHYFSQTTPPPSPASVFPVNSSRGSVAQLMEHLPPRKLAEAATTYYFRHVSWYVHGALPRPVYDRYSNLVWEAAKTQQAPDALILAVVVSVWTLGFANIPSSKAVAVGLTGAYAPEVLEKTCYNIATNALTLARYLERPSLDAIRTLVILASQCLAISTGDDVGAGVAFSALAMQCSIQLRLHRDPLKVFPAHMPPEEVQDRRRLFWTVFQTEQLSSTATGRKSTILHLRDVDTLLPLDLPDEEMHLLEPSTPVETNMTYTLPCMRLAQLSEKISDEVFGTQPTSYARVLEFTREIYQLDSETPEVFRYTSQSFTSAGGSDEARRMLKAYMLRLAVCQQLLRLHRPYFAKPGETSYSSARNICLDAAEDTVVIFLSPICYAPWAGPAYKALCACIVLAVDLLREPGGPRADRHREYVTSCTKHFELFSDQSTLCRRGAKVLRCLLHKKLSTSPTSKPAPQWEENTHSPPVLGNVPTSSAEAAPRPNNHTSSTYTFSYPSSFTRGDAGSSRAPENMIPISRPPTSAAPFDFDFSAMFGLNAATAPISTFSQVTSSDATYSTYPTYTASYAASPDNYGSPEFTLTHSPLPPQSSTRPSSSYHHSANDTGPVDFAFLMEQR